MQLEILVPNLVGNYYSSLTNRSCLLNEFSGSYLVWNGYWNIIATNMLDVSLVFRRHLPLLLSIPYELYANMWLRKNESHASLYSCQEHCGIGFAVFQKRRGLFTVTGGSVFRRNGFCLQPSYFSLTLLPSGRVVKCLSNCKKNVSLFEEMLNCRPKPGVRLVLTNDNLWSKFLNKLERDIYTSSNFPLRGFVQIPPSERNNHHQDWDLLRQSYLYHKSVFFWQSLVL